MKRGKLPRHLTQKTAGGTFYATLDIPKDVRPFLGNKPRFFKSLHTDSLTVAESKKWKLVNQWKELIAQCRSPGSSNRHAMAIMRADIEVTGKDPLDLAMLEEAHHNIAVDAAMDGDRSLLTAKEIVYGDKVLLEEVLPVWVKRKKEIDQVTPKTFDDYHSILQTFLRSFKYLNDVSPEKVKKWLDKQDVQLKRKKLYMTALRGFLKVVALENKKHVIRPDDLLRGVLDEMDIPKDQRRKRKADQRQHFEDSQVATLLSNAAKQDLKDLILLGAYTGARIDELCSLKVDQVTDQVFKIRDAKTESGDRDVPIHSMLKQTVARLIDQSADGYLMSGLSADKYGHRSNAIGKRFGRLKTSLGYDDRFVFHSLRKSFITKLERAGVPESTIARIVGHQIDEGRSLALGLYSGGLSYEQLSPAVEKVIYGA